MNFHIFLRVASAAGISVRGNQEFKMSESTPFPSGSALNFNRIVAVGEKYSTVVAVLNSLRNSLL